MGEGVGEVAGSQSSPSGVFRLGGEQGKIYSGTGRRRAAREDRRGRGGLGKKTKKNVEAELKKHTKAHEELVSKAGGDVGKFVAGVAQELEGLEKELASLNK